jgi:hypothetical protein
LFGDVRRSTGAFSKISQPPTRVGALQKQTGTKEMKKTLVNFFSIHGTSFPFGAARKYVNLSRASFVSFPLIELFQFCTKRQLPVF